MSAARRPWPANAAAIGSAKLADLGEVLVAAPGEREDVEAAADGLVRGPRPLPCRGVDPGSEQPRHRVRGLERRHDALEATQRAEGRHRIAVGDRDVAHAPDVAQVRVLGTRARVVEPGGDRVRLEYLAVVVLQ